jgi:hypothetical protein
MTNNFSDELLDQAIALSNTVQDNYFDLGYVLYELKEGDYYKLIDNKAYYSDKHSKWKQFCEEKLPISYRTAQYWLNLYRYFNEMNVDKEVLKRIGWSKAKELIDFTDNADTLNEALELAENGTIGELRAYVKRFKESVEGTSEVLKGIKFNFKLFEEAAEGANLALAAAGRTTDGDLNQAFFKICIEWYQLTNPDVKEEEVFTDAVAEVREEELVF